MKTLLQQQLGKKILILDGAMGTMLQKIGLKPEDFGEQDLEGCNEVLNSTRADLITLIHESYLEAGADIIETNSFGANRVVLAEYGLEDRDIELNEKAASLAKVAAERWSTSQWPRFAAGSMGPTTKMLSLTGGITFEELEEAYYRQALGLIRGGADLLIIETSQDTLNVKAAGKGILRALRELGTDIPLIISATIEAGGTMLGGQNIEAFYISVRHLNPLAVSLNCGTGAEQMRDHVRTLAAMAGCAVCCYPNAGLPDEEGDYSESPDEFAAKLAFFAEQGWLNIAGGCCGTTAEHIRKLAASLQNYSPRRDRAIEASAVSGIEAVWPEDENRPLLVGERSNVIGSRIFREMIAEEKYEEGSEIARAQVKKGAQIVDVCVANPDRNELEDMKAFLPYVVKKVKAPLMLDSTDSAVLEEGLKLTQGKAIINSVNLENGLERFQDVVPLLKKYGAAVVVGVIDEEGMALTRQRKLEVALRSYEILVKQYGIAPQDLIFDPLVFPVGTGDSKYLGSAVETIEGLRLIKEALPACKTILGISNVSFGLPPVGREVLNAVFVYHNTLAGLDYAIVNAEKIRRYPSIPEEEKKLAEELLFRTNEESLNRFVNYYREKKVIQEKEVNFSLEERLSNYIIEAARDGLAEDLEQALKEYKPLEIINGPLMQGMEKVGELFDQNQLIVAEVLQSAEVMKTAVGILQPYMEKADEAVKGKVVLATVKGDVHDIGKNLVEIILENNGYKVINLGVKVDSGKILESCRQEKPDAIGLSGLLVKSVQQMRLTAQDLKTAGVNIPLLLGGAALTAKYTREKIAPVYEGSVFYAKDAMESLSILKKVIAGKNELPEQVTGREAGIDPKANEQNLPEQESPQKKRKAERPEFSKDEIDYDSLTPIPPDFDRHLLLNYELDRLIPYLDIDFLMGHYLGVNGAKQANYQESLVLDKFRAKTKELRIMVLQFLEEIKQKKIVIANGVYRFLPAASQDEKIYVYDPKDLNKVLEIFSFPRSSQGQGICLADYIRPLDSGSMDYLGFFAVTTGVGVRLQSENLRKSGNYLKSYLLQVIILEMVEAFAEQLHSELRTIWGIPDPGGTTIKERKQGKYRGIRVSPGYPMCPDLETQNKVFRILKPQDIGIRLIESLMMDPEASVTALVFSHPQAKIVKMK